jgi:hypothetical protein
VRLIIAGAWGRLEPDTAAEAEALERSATQGDWTIGRGPAAIAALRTLAYRLGHPVSLTEERETPQGPPPRFVIVKRGDTALAERLRAIASPGVPIIWDRRKRQRRRVTDRPISDDRRRRDRRRPLATTLDTLGFLVVRPSDRPADVPT